MNSIFNATLILGSSSVASLFIGLLTNKIWAVVLGADGVGYLGLLQSLLTLIGLAASLALNVSLVRFGAEAVAQADMQRFEAIRQAAWWLTGLLAVLSLILLYLLRQPLARWMIGQSEPTTTVLLMGVAMLFNQVYVNYTALLNAHHRVTALAQAGFFNRLAVATLSIMFITAWQEKGVIPSLIAGAAASAWVAWYFYRREVPPPACPTNRQQTCSALQSLVAFGLPCTASQFVGAGVQMLIPALVLILLDKESVGLYRQAIMISIAYLGLVLTAMGQDYYPRLAAINQQPEKLVGLVNEQNQLAMLMGLPLIALLLAFGPWLVPLILSKQFLPLLAILQWQFLGDVLKFPGWTMAFVLLARNRSRAYFIVEAIGGGANLLFTLFAVKGFGLPGVGIAYFLMYAVYYAAVWRFCRREIPMVWTPLNRRLILAGLGTLALMNWVDHQAAWQHLRTPLCAILALGLTAWCLCLVQSQYDALNHIHRKLTARFFS